MAKKKSKKSGKQQPKVTMQALREMSSDDEDDGSLPPESEWNLDAKALKVAIEKGTFDQLLQNNKKSETNDDESSMEEVDLDDDDDEDSSSSEEDDDARKHAAAPQKSADNQDDLNEEEKSESSSSSGSDNDDDDDEQGESEDDAGLKQDDDSENEEDNETAPPGIEEKNTVKKKALQVVTEALIAQKRGMPWAETFDIITDTPLPFNDAPEDIHDDLKREVAFYDTALQAVLVAKQKCQQAGIPFQRPDDFFAEMVKTDDHMAKVKDRLIFENKKMDAVAQRKANKEQKLRAKESHAHKLEQKAKRKKDHFRAVQDWAQSAASNRGRRLADHDDGGEAFFQQQQQHKKGNNKKRQYADKKYGFGGKRGRFKQNDPAAYNDVSGYDRRGNFGGMGTKRSASNKPKTGGAGSNRRGKRARDASRQSSSNR